MARDQQEAYMAHDHDVHRGRSITLGGIIGQIESLDETTQWALIVSKACEAGLDKEEICVELSCSWSTVTRWRAGQTAPGPFLRQAVKAKLVEMLGRLRRSEERRAVEAAPSVSGNTLDASSGSRMGAPWQGAYPTGVPPMAADSRVTGA